MKQQRDVENLVQKWDGLVVPAILKQLIIYSPFLEMLRISSLSQSPKSDLLGLSLTHK